MLNPLLFTYVSSISYVFLNHFVGHSLFQLVRFSSLSDIIKRHFAPTLAKLHFYVDSAIGFLRESSVTVSICLVWGNMSTGWMRSTA